MLANTALSSRALARSCPLRFLGLGPEYLNLGEVGLGRFPVQMSASTPIHHPPVSSAGHPCSMPTLFYPHRFSGRLAAVASSRVLRFAVRRHGRAHSSKDVWGAQGPARATSYCRQGSQKNGRREAPHSPISESTLVATNSGSLITPNWQASQARIVNRSAVCLESVVGFPRGPTWRETSPDARRPRVPDFR